MPTTKMTGFSSAPKPKAPTPPKPVVTKQTAQPLTGTSPHGFQYVVQPAPGGSYHVWPNGQRTFVPAKAATTPATQPATASAGSQAAAAPQPTEPDPAATVAPDSEYATQQAATIFKIGQRRTALGEEGRIDTSNYEEALRRMAGNEETSLGNTDVENHRMGLFSSGKNAKDVQDVRDSYKRQRADALGGLTSRNDARSRELTGLDQGYLNDEGVDYGDTAARQIEGDTSLAKVGSLAPADPIAPKVAAKKTPTKKASSTVRPKYKTTTAKNGAVYHVYAGGRKVAVKKATRKVTK